MNDTSSKHIPEAVETFIDRWIDRDSMERANYQLFLTELCRLLDLPGPEPAGPDPKPRKKLAWPKTLQTQARSIRARELICVHLS